MKVNINTISQMKKYLARINQIPLENIVFYTKDNKIISLSQSEIDDWDFTGLSNVDFIINKWDTHGKS